ncbi:MAG: acetate/propionate family kinase [Hyphomicrobium sp.]
MRDAVLVINAGSSSIKFAGYAGDDDEEPKLIGKGEIEGIGSEPRFVVEDPEGRVLDERRWPDGAALPHEEAFRFIMSWIGQNASDIRLIAAGHRVVHGGLTYTQAIRIDEAVLAKLEAFVALAPLHQPHNLAAIRAMATVNPELPQVACFDTAFHRTQPKVARMFALPREMAGKGICRYGFHGLSYEYMARKLPTYAPHASRVNVAHLGNGASMCAMRDGHSIETTMGFTAVDGLPMGSRTGALDPGVVLYLMQEMGMDAAAIQTLLYERSGLLGISGISNDMRELLASDDPRAGEAVEYFVYQIAKHFGALTAVLEGVDAFVFTAGIGENAPAVREAVCRRLAWYGIDLDAESNRRGGPRITRPDSRISAWVIPTDEEKMIATHTLGILKGVSGALSGD